MAFRFNLFTGTLDITSSSGSGSGNVTGEPPTDINAIARWDSTDGTLIKNSPGTFVQDSGAINAQAFVFDRQIINDVIVPDHYSVIATDIEILTGSIILQGDAELVLI